MFGGLFDHMAGLFKSFSWGSLSGVLFTVTFIWGAAYVYDQSTGYSYYERLSHKAEVLQYLSEGVQLDSSSAHKIRQMSTAVINEMYRDTASATEENQSGFALALKVVAANWLLWLVFISAVKDRRTRKSVVSNNTVLGTVSVIIASSIAYLAAADQFTFVLEWWSVILWPIVLMIPILIVGLAMKRHTST